MSYIRLLKLPPHSQVAGVARWCRRQFSAGGERPNNLRDSSSMDTGSNNTCCSRNSSVVHSCSGSRNITSSSGTSTSNIISHHYHSRGQVQDHQRQQTGNDRCHTAGAATLQGVTRHGHDMRVGMDTRGVTGKHGQASVTTLRTHITWRDEGLPFKRRPGLQKTTSLGALSSTPEIMCTGSQSRRGAWGQRDVQWMPLRGFSSTPPPDQRESVDSTDQHHGQRALPGQRAFLGGLLKPSDVSRQLIHPWRMLQRQK